MKNDLGNWDWVGCSILVLFLFFWWIPSGFAQQRAGQEILYPSKDFARLDTFEGVNLEDADKLFNKKDFKGAFAAYKAYSFEFGKSAALPYVLLRMGRCLHILDKRNAAIKAYQNVVDYFPDDIRYAAAALYYIGECHGQNGDEAKKAATWAKMVKDDGYVTQPNSGTALSYLGGEMEKLKKFDEAAEYQWRTAVAFQKSNIKAAAAARSAVLFHYTIRNPNHSKLKEFYTAASGFDGRGKKVDDPELDARFWSEILREVLDPKSSASVEQRKNAGAYWVAKVGDRFFDQDDLRKQWFDAQYLVNGDEEAWSANLEKQYAQKQTSIPRLLKWCDYLKVRPELRAAFFVVHAKALLAAMKDEEKMNLVAKLLSRDYQMKDEAQAVLRLVDPSGMGDVKLVRFCKLIGYFESEETVMRIIGRIKDKALAAKTRFDYHDDPSRQRSSSHAEKALAEIPLLLKNPAFAQGLAMRKAQILQKLNRHDEAIKAFRVANVQPASTWGVTDSMIALKQFAQAVKTVRQLESVGGSTAAKASLRVADIFRMSNQKGKEVDQLRLILRRYPKSRESSDAHNRLEKYGLALTGGESEADE